MCPKQDLNLHVPNWTQAPQACVSTNSTIRALLVSRPFGTAMQRYVFFLFLQVFFNNFLKKIHTTGHKIHQKDENKVHKILLTDYKSLNLPSYTVCVPTTHIYAAKMKFIF